MEHVWRVNGGASTPNRVLKACLKCKRTKKKCYHQEHSHWKTAPSSTCRKVALGTAIQSTSVEAVDREGDLVPRSILADLSPASSPGRAGDALYGSKQMPIRQLSLQDPRSMLERFRFSGSRTQNLSEQYMHYLESLHCWDALPKSTTDALLPIYVSYIDACIPILDGNGLLSAYFTGKSSNLLVKAVCLLVCKTEEAAPFLKTSETGSVLCNRDFADEIYQSLGAALEADLEPDRLARIQILALMHTHHSHSRAVEESSKRLSQAIHDCFTLSLNYCEPGRLPDDEPSLLWWTLLTLDRINACVASRPMMFSTTNMTIGRPVPSNSYRSKLVCAWLRLSDLLEQVYQIYIPPYEQEGWTGDFPSFEILCSGLQPESFQKAHHSTLRLYYATIGMLSCRAGPPGTSSYARRTASADSLDEIVDCIGLSRLAPMPLLPYSVSLALTVAYRDLRDNVKSSHKAIKNIGVRCAYLDTLGGQWPTAAAMARLGKSVLGKVQGTRPCAESQPNCTGINVDGEMRETRDEESLESAYSDFDEIFGPLLDTSWTQLSQDSLFFPHLA